MVVKLCGLLEISYVHIIAVSIIITIFGVLGDLVESQLKRNFGVKDSGNIMPGHGGMLDRFDGALLAFPVAVLYLYFLLTFNRQTMKIHKEGYGIIATTFAIYFVILGIIVLISGWHCTSKTVCIAGAILSLFITNFFRCPKRISVIDKDLVVSSCDGKVVIVQEVDENEYLKRRCIQVSVFMSIFNVHVNYYPIGGKVVYCKHHHGNYIVANHPKSSEKTRGQALL